MSNTIRFNDKTSVDDWIGMSNGLTSGFIKILVLSGSAIAETETEKQMIVWLAEKNQSAVGIGTVGFDVVEMPWDKADFPSLKAFMLRAADEALSKKDWDKLGYTPNDSFVMPCLEKFRQYIERMTEADIREEARSEWLERSESDDPVKCGFPRCKKHGTLLSLYGCNICND